MDATIDQRAKILLLRDPRAVAEWLFGRRVLRVRTIDPGFTTTQSRIGDKLMLGEFRQRRKTLLHPEVQLDGDRTMGSRMMAYMGLIAHLLSSTAHRRCGFRQVVIYLDPDRYLDDPGEFYLQGEDVCAAYVRYRVIRLWEVDPKELRRTRSPWIEPFVPLCRVRDVKRAVVESRDRILKSRLGREDRQEVLACLCGMAGIRIRDREQLIALFRGIDMGESVMVKYWIEQGEERGREEGLKEGRKEGREEAAMLVLEVLRARFGRVPADVAERVKAQGNGKRLLRLARAAGRAATIKEFRAAL